jgi:hypothetical protein
MPNGKRLEDCTRDELVAMIPGVKVKRTTKVELKKMMRCRVCGRGGRSACLDLENATGERGWCVNFVRALNERLKMRRRYEGTLPRSDRRSLDFTFDKLG